MQKKTFFASLSLIAGSSNGRMQLSESCHLGSNPSPAEKIEHCTKCINII